MKSMLTASAAALALFLVGCGDGGGNKSAPADTAALKQIPAPNNGDWTQTVVKTPEGGYRMGTPDAPVKLVEYGSMSWPHWAELQEQGGAGMRDTSVQSGPGRWGLSTYFLLPTAPGASLLPK